MSVKERIQISLLIERINKQKAFSKKLGLEDRSKFHGEYIDREEEEIC